MVSKNNLHRVIETDVLVIGGGMGGPSAALWASEGGAKVVLLEKADVRRSGSSGMGIGSWHQLTSPFVSLEDVAKQISSGERGTLMGTLGYLRIMRGIIDENLLYVGYRDNWDAVHGFERFGIKVKWGHDYFFEKARPDNIRWHAREIKRHIARALQSSPVTVLERTMGVELLTDKDGKVAGATALNVRTGEFMVIKAKAVILATGTISRIFNPLNVTAMGRYKMLYTYHSGAGDGAAMAYRVGAELINMEGSGNGAFADGTRSEKVPQYIASKGARLYDALGNRLPWEDCVGGLSLKTQYKLEKEGRAPAFWDGAELPDEWHRSMHMEDYAPGDTEWHFRPECQPIGAKFLRERGYDTRKSKIEIVHYRAEHNAIFSGVLYDENGQTCVDRLYACGDMCGGSTFMGLAQAVVFGMKAAKHILANLKTMKHLDIDEGQVAAQKKLVFAPRKVKNGVEPLEVEVKIRDICERYCPSFRSEGSINQGLLRLQQVRDKFLPLLQARDNHELMSAQEVRYLFRMAEAYMLAARERKEGGMNNYRLDYQDKWDAPFESAVIVKMENGEPKVSRRKMPGLRPEFIPKK